MLSLRSKVAVGAVLALGVGGLFEYLVNLGSWSGEPGTGDWYIGWMILGILAAGALVSIVIDVRKDRSIL